MSTKKELADEFINLIKTASLGSSDLQKSTVTTITKTINGLVYQETNKPLSKEDKFEIVELIQKSADNKNHMILVSSINAELTAIETKAKNSNG